MSLSFPDRNCMCNDCADAFEELDREAKKSKKDKKIDQLTEDLRTANLALKNMEARNSKQNERIGQMEAALKALNIPDPTVPQVLKGGESFRFIQGDQDCGVFTLTDVEVKYERDYNSFFKSLPELTLSLEATRVGL